MINQSVNSEGLCNVPYMGILHALHSPDSSHPHEIARWAMGSDFERVLMAPRSRLYHLEPIGVGTAEVESLTSYISRLAEVHAVSVKSLVVHEISQQLDTPYARQPHLIKSFWVLSSTLNSCSTSTNKWLSALASLTCRRDLHPLTMTVWQHVMPTRRLVRANQAWCPHCYDEWRQSGRPIYQPL